MTNIKTLIRRPKKTQDLSTNFDQSLQYRFILNTGQTQIKISQDKRFEKYVLQRARHIIPETILEPGEHISVDHEYFISQPLGDHTKASMRDCFSHKELTMHQQILKNEK